jgi:hypothetical protein
LFCLQPVEVIGAHAQKRALQRQRAVIGALRRLWQNR